MVDNNDHAHVVEQCSSSFVSGNTLGSQNRGAALAKLAVVDREAPINDGKHGRGKVSVLVVLDGTQRSTEVSGSCQNLWRVSRFLPSTCDLAATTRHRRCCPRKFIRSSASNSQKSLTSLSLSLSLFLVNVYQEQGDNQSCSLLFCSSAVRTRLHIPRRFFFFASSCRALSSERLGMYCQGLTCRNGKYCAHKRGALFSRWSKEMT